jgi:hypothetical protein
LEVDVEPRTDLFTELDIGMHLRKHQARASAFSSMICSYSRAEATSGHAGSLPLLAVYLFTCKKWTCRLLKEPMTKLKHGEIVTLRLFQMTICSSLHTSIPSFHPSIGQVSNLQICYISLPSQPGPRKEGSHPMFGRPLLSGALPGATPGPCKDIGYAYIRSSPLSPHTKQSPKNALTGQPALNLEEVGYSIFYPCAPIAGKGWVTWFPEPVDEMVNGYKRFLGKDGLSWICEYRTSI